MKYFQKKVKVKKVKKNVQVKNILPEDRQSTSVERIKLLNENIISTLVLQLTIGTSNIFPRLGRQGWDLFLDEKNPGIEGSGECCFRPKETVILSTMYGKREKTTSCLKVCFFPS